MQCQACLLEADCYNKSEWLVIYNPVGTRTPAVASWFWKHFLVISVMLFVLNELSLMLWRLGSPMRPIFSMDTINFPCFSLIEILLLVTKSDNLGASWPQGFFLTVEPWWDASPSLITWHFGQSWQRFSYICSLKWCEHYMKTSESVLSCQQ